MASVASAVAAILAVVLFLLKKYGTRQAEAERREDEAYKRTEEANRSIASGDVDTVSRNLDRTMADIDAHDRLLSPSTSASRRSDTDPKK